MRNLSKVLIGVGAFLVVLALSFGALIYATAGNASDTDPLTLNGPWQDQVNSATFVATITGDSIEIQWTDGDDTSGLYWKGSFPTPPNMTVGSEFVVESIGDTEAMEASLLGSQNKTKVFTYDNGELSFTMTVAGVSTIVRLEKQDLGV
jgi:hypothetical protein